MAEPSLVLTPDGGTSTELINGPLGNVLRDGLSLPVPTYDETFADSAMSEGGPLVSSKPNNVVATVQLLLKGDLGSAYFNANRNVWQQQVEACRRNGGTLTYTPRDGVAVTYLIESARVTELPVDDIMERQKRGLTTAEFVCKPWGRLAAIDSYPMSMIDSFGFDSVNNGDWTYDAGAGTLTAGAGQLTPTSTAQKAIRRGGVMVYQPAQTWRFHTGASVAATWDLGVYLKWVSGSSILQAGINATGLYVGKWTGTWTDLATQAVTLSPNTDYWLKATLVGSAVTVAVYASDPNVSPAPVALASRSYTLTGGDATAWSGSVAGQVGANIVPKGTDWLYYNWRLDAAYLRQDRPVFSAWLLDVPGSVPAEVSFEINGKADRAYVDLGIKSADRRTYLPVFIDSGLPGFVPISGTFTNDVADATAWRGTKDRKLFGTQDWFVQVFSGYFDRLDPGPYRVRARIYKAAASDLFVGAFFGSEAYEGGYLPLVNLPSASGVFDVDLGLIWITKTSGHLDFNLYQKGSALNTEIDYVILMPAEFWGKAQYDAWPWALLNDQHMQLRSDGYFSTDTQKYRRWEGGLPRAAPGDNRFVWRQRTNNIADTPAAGADEANISGGLLHEIWNVRVTPRVALLGA